MVICPGANIYFVPLDRTSERGWGGPPWAPDVVWASVQCTVVIYATELNRVSALLRQPVRMSV